MGPRSPRKCRLLSRLSCRPPSGFKSEQCLRSTTLASEAFSGQASSFCVGSGRNSTCLPVMIVCTTHSDVVLHDVCLYWSRWPERMVQIAPCSHLRFFFKLDPLKNSKLFRCTMCVCSVALAERMVQIVPPLQYSKLIRCSAAHARSRLSRTKMEPLWSSYNRSKYAY